MKYYEENLGCNTVKCPYCQNLFHLLLRTKDYDAIKSVWFKGTILYNRSVMHLIFQNVITREQAAEILGVNVLYINKVYDEIYLKEK